MYFLEYHDVDLIVTKTALYLLKYAICLNNCPQREIKEQLDTLSGSTIVWNYRTACYIWSAFMYFAKQGKST